MDLPEEGVTAAAPAHTAAAASACPSDAPESIEDLATGAMNNVLPKDPLGAKIEKLKKEQAEMKAQKKRLQKDLRNAERKKKRLSERARKLTDKDLVAVLLMRKNQRDARTTAEKEPGASRPVSGASESGSHASAA